MLDFTTLIIIVAIVGLPCFLWRWLCQYYCIPWPYWLAFWLENPYMIIFSHPQRLLKLAKLTPGQQVLELGCGAGRVLIPAAQRLAPSIVYGVDCQKNMLRLLHNKRKRLRLENIEALQGDVRTMNFPSAAFDRILLITVLGEIPQYEGIIPRLKMALAKEGLISVTEVLPDPCYIPARRMKKIFRRHGFEVAHEYHNLVSYTINFKLA